MSSPSPTSPASSTTTSPSTTSSTQRPTADTDNWDASKVPPSQFQRRQGSIYSTPNTKDGSVERGDRDRAYFEKLKEKVSVLFRDEKEGREDDAN
jgi:hypothetical protein